MTAPSITWPLDVPPEVLRRRRSAKWTTFAPDVLPLPIAELDVRLAPAITAALRQAVDGGDTGYPGDPTGLRKAFAGFAGQRWHWDLDGADIRTTGDVAAGVIHVLRLITRPGDGVVITPPVYHPFWEWLASTGTAPVEVPLLDVEAGGRLDLAGIEAAVRGGAKVVLLCHPHNPTGRIHSRDELEALAGIAERYGATVLADEIHAPLTHPGQEFTPYLQVSARSSATGIAFHSASKAWNLAGLKCALIVAGHPAQQAVLQRLPYEVPWSAGHFGLVAGEAAYAEGGEWLYALAAGLAANVDLLGTLLAEHLPDVRFAPPQAGFLAWLDCTRLGLDADPAAFFLERGRVALSPGPDFGGPGEGFVRLNLGTSPAILDEAVRRMAQAVATPSRRALNTAVPPGAHRVSRESGPRTLD